MMALQEEWTSIASLATAQYTRPQSKHILTIVLMLLVYTTTTSGTAIVGGSNK